MHKFYGQFDPPVDKFIFERYFPDTSIKGVFVECGAFDGLMECSCKFFEETMGWSGFNLEPAPSNFRALAANRPLAKNIQQGLSDRNGRLSFTHVISPILGENFGNGSIHHTEAHLNNLKERGCEFQVMQIEVVTWKEFVEREKILHVDLFVLDVEGHELAVIAGMHDCDVLPDVICIEVGHLELQSIKTQLQKLKYSYDISSHVNAFFIKNEKISLFAHRAAAKANGGNGSFLVPKGTLPSIGVDPLREASEALQEENQGLKMRIDEMTCLYHEIVNSKAWMVVEKLRRWLR